MRLSKSLRARLHDYDRPVGSRMATEKQIAANRANAKRSTGPKTRQGRQVSSRNALRHGLFSSQVSQPRPMDVSSLSKALVQKEPSEFQLIAARQVAQAHLDLLQIRAVRATLLSSWDQHAWSSSDLRRLLALDRYERIVRGRRRLAAKRFFSE